MIIDNLTLEDTEIIAAILTNISYKLGDAQIIIPIRQKLIDVIDTNKPKKEELPPEVPTSAPVEVK